MSESESVTDITVSADKQFVSVSTNLGKKYTHSPYYLLHGFEIYWIYKYNNAITKTKFDIIPC